MLRKNHKRSINWTKCCKFNVNSDERKRVCAAVYIILVSLVTNVDWDGMIACECVCMCGFKCGAPWRCGSSNVCLNTWNNYISFRSILRVPLISFHFQRITNFMHRHSFVSNLVNCAPFQGKCLIENFQTIWCFRQAMSIVMWMFISLDTWIYAMCSL